MKGLVFFTVFCSFALLSLDFVNYLDIEPEYIDKLFSLILTAYTAALATAGDSNNA